MVVLGGTLEEKSGLGLGCMSVSGQYSNGIPLDPETSLKFFRGVYDAGSRHFDTAEIYKSGALWAPPSDDIVFNESQLGQFFATVPRDSFTIASKFMPLPPFRENNDCSYDTVKAALTASLGRLGLSYLDLYYCHAVPTCEVGQEFTRSAMRLKEEGLIRNIGLSEVSAESLRAAHAIHPICCIQQEWSLLTRNLEEALLPTCKELGIGIVAYSPLARNLLTVPKERPTDVRRSVIPRFNEENWEQNAAMGRRLEELAAKSSASPAQLSLAWLVQKAKDLGVSCLPIPGTANLHHALDNIASMKVTLTPEDMKLLEDIAADVAGARECQDYLRPRLEGQTGASLT
mmetsp:Transcript_33853/g.79133  ORF Transcript_33853/g.79133 Transcript_33853/m.79133 type:complete len:345 (-) Transcript_33853:116-1150(-)|eukprot:CAMPEP_0178378738 /NCGR_PEP_ID=MMETSP0689_2-20121128/4581_1 /TAXON_ID=160604 /ORGANISM="Amphidinium massartii, Strain CS-259" /LENGTH=344 /DNA_ID=CAMNT_0019998817 /DNA_START=18 /DNA_END=1052 /DNA_ORIENTATION=-